MCVKNIKAVTFSQKNRKGSLMGDKQRDIRTADITCKRTVASWLVISSTNTMTL